MVRTVVTKNVHRASKHYTDGAGIYRNNASNAGRRASIRNAMRNICTDLAEFDFRHNNRESLGVNDMGRTANALKGAKGKRLSYHPLTTTD